MQVASTILMVRPASFGFNRETASTNAFQQIPAAEDADILRQAQEEFDTLVETLLAKKIEVLVVQDLPQPPKPDAIFPGNWFSTHTSGELNVFPLKAANRRLEKRDDILLALARKFLVSDLLDWSEYEPEGFFLEGTGSMVMDHVAKIIYACQSDRTHKVLLEKYAARHGYRIILFSAKDQQHFPIFHTNLMLCIGQSFALLCEAAIRDEFERIAVIQLLSTTSHQVIPISLEQVRHFAGNMAPLKNAKGEDFIFLSRGALNCLTKEQIRKLSSYAELVPVPIPTIESIGGGSIRSMMAEIFLPPQEEKY